jgi:DNA-binding HxlR family transcriptional regulator
MRSYGEFCGLAKSLDIVGDRWALLIVRELLIREPCRYTDLRHGLPGIATNLLADRLKELDAAGVLSREEAPPPIATTLYRLTPRGRALDPAIRELGRWGAPLLAAAPRSDALRLHWLAMPVWYSLTDHAPNNPPATLALHAGRETMYLEAAGGSVCARFESTDEPDAVMTGPRRLIAAVLLGHVDLRTARAAGLQYEGDLAVLKRIQPRAGR